MSDASIDDTPTPGKGKKARKGKKSRPAKDTEETTVERTRDEDAQDEVTQDEATVDEGPAAGGRSGDARAGTPVADEDLGLATVDVPAFDPEDADGRAAEDPAPLDDGPAEPPVIGCTRCDARVVMGSRYCPSCGVPLVRSGEQAATALSRTRRRAPILIRLVVPLLLLGVLGAIWYVANLDPIEDEKDSLTSQLTRVVDDHRTLSDRLEELERQTDPADALGAARSALSTVQDVQDETEGVESGTTGRTSRVRRAMATDRAYLAAVVSVLKDPRSKVLRQLGARSARAVAALRSVDDIVSSKDAIRGTQILGQSVRARLANGGTAPKTATTASGASSTTTSPFVNAVDRAITRGATVRPRLSRGFALLRAARDGVDTWDGTGAKPATPEAALSAANDEFEAIATSRAASAERAGDIPTRNQNQAGVTEKLAAAYTAGAATANRLTSCVGSFQNTGAQSVARQCLQIVREQSTAESTAVGAFADAFRPAREAAGLSGPVPKL